VNAKKRFTRLHQNAKIRRWLAYLSRFSTKR
jgi:hypothetical protein